MATRTFTDITDANRVWVELYVMESIESFERETLLITGDRGYPNHFRVDVTFLGHKYLACATAFEGEVRWRMATADEARMIRQAYWENSDINVYCIEEDLDRFRPRPNKAPQKFFIVASSVEIVVTYEGEDIDRLVGLIK